MAKNKDKKLPNETENKGLDDFEDIENPLNIDDDNSDDEREYTKSQLMKLSGAELAKIAKPYVNVSIVTLEGYSKEQLSDIILNKGKEKKVYARQARQKSDARIMIEGYFNFLDTIKIEREQKPLNQPVKELVTNNAENLLDKYFKEDSPFLNGASWAVLCGGTLFLTVDALIGIQNVKPLFEKYIKKDKNGTSDASKAK